MEIEGYKINELKTDEFGRVSGILSIDKPIGVKSFDVVDVVRKKFNTKQVGHAGTLDPFASGLLIVLIGKTTKLSDKFLTMDKEYVAEVLFGISTNTGDIDGEITQTSTPPVKVTQKSLEANFTKFTPSYNQFVPVFSSVKVNGQKLRVLARTYDSFELKDIDDKRVIVFKNEQGEIKKEVNLPNKEVKIYELELSKLEDKGFVIKEGKVVPEENGNSYPIAQLRIKCSKGTYIRQLAVDIGVSLGLPAMLVNLRRTQIGDINSSYPGIF